MQSNYYPIKKAYRKMMIAEGNYAAVYIYGATGYGKTRLVQEFLKGKKYVELSPIDEEWNLEELESAIDKEQRLYVVVDDLQKIQCQSQKDVLLDLMERDDIWLVMIGRMQTPQWFMSQIAKGNLLVISENDLHLTVEEVKEIACKEGVEIDDTLIQRFVEEGQGNIYVILSMVQMLKSDNNWTEAMEKQAAQFFSYHLEHNIIAEWDVSLQEFLMQMSVVDQFTLPMAIMVTGDDQAAVMIEEAFAIGNFLREENGTYYIRSNLVEALSHRALKVLGLQEYRRCQNRVALYYELQNEYVNALKLYTKAMNKEGIRKLLIRNARRHMGNGGYYDLRKYYLALEEKEVASSPVLMGAVSMLYSVMMNALESEKWYQKLKDYASHAQGGQKKEANQQLLYLDISLPHRGNINLVDILKRASSLMKQGKVELPEVSLTNNQPSTMNGGKDFCNWSKRDQFLADTIGSMVENLLGKFGRGLKDAALCESFYEKGGRDEEVLQHAILVQMAVDSGGKTELLFATVGIQIRLHILKGNLYHATHLLESFKQRVQKENKAALLINVEALACRIALVTGNEEIVHQWMKTAPDENQEFWTLERYRYLTKVRCYLSFGKNMEAIDLLEKLIYYANNNNRTYIRMESKLLLAIALKREKREWETVLLEAINEIEEYKFVRIISEKGAGIFPLLKVLQKKYLNQKKVNKIWFGEVLKETEEQAKRYPGYLNADVAKPADFGETAIAVLKMQADGMTMKDIAVHLKLSERTVKYHAAENYRKLGAKGKIDAVQIARNLHLL